MVESKEVLYQPPPPPLGYMSLLPFSLGKTWAVVSSHFTFLRNQDAGRCLRQESQYYRGGSSTRVSPHLRAGTKALYSVEKGKDEQTIYDVYTGSPSLLSSLFSLPPRGRARKGSRTLFLLHIRCMNNY